VAVGLFAYKGLWLTVGLYALFALLALVGWRTWARRAAGLPA
jgi:nicotinamide mononucleotide transporter